MVVVTNAVAPFLLPVKDRIHETTGLTESVISIMSINDNRMGDSKVNVWIKVTRAAARIT
jgi:hypothetical protein